MQQNDAKFKRFLKRNYYEAVFHRAKIFTSEPHCLYDGPENSEKKLQIHMNQVIYKRETTIPVIIAHTPPK